MTGLTAIELGVLARLGVGEEALKQGEEIAMTDAVKRVAKNLAGRLGCVPDDAGCVEHPERAWDAGYGLCGVAVMLAEDAVTTMKAEPGELPELARDLLALAVKRRAKGDMYAPRLDGLPYADRYHAEAEVMRRASIALTALTLDEGKIAEELRKHKLIHASVSRKSAFCRCNSSAKAGVDDNIAWFDAHRARAVVEALGGAR